MTTRKWFTPHTGDGRSSFVKIIQNCIQLCQLTLDKQVLNFIDKCGRFIENTRTGNLSASALWCRDEEASSFVRKSLYKQKEKLHWSSLYNPIPCCFLTRRHASKCTDLECKIAHCYLIKNGSFCMISWKIIIFCSASKQSPVLSQCKQCFCWVPEPRAAFSPPRENAFD